MTRKDYVLIAESLRMALAQCRMLPGEAATFAVIGAERAAHAIACDLARDNARFDRARFLAACGVAS